MHAVTFFTISSLFECSPTIPPLPPKLHCPVNFKPLFMYFLNYMYFIFSRLVFRERVPWTGTFEKCYLGGKIVLSKDVMIIIRFWNVVLNSYFPYFKHQNFATQIKNFHESIHSFTYLSFCSLNKYSLIHARYSIKDCVYGDGQEFFSRNTFSNWAHRRKSHCNANRSTKCYRNMWEEANNSGGI